MATILQLVRAALVAAPAIGVIGLLTTLPFLPGPYDPLAGPVSQLALVFGTLGLALVSPGAAWTAAVLRQSERGSRIAAIVACVIGAAVWLVLTLLGFSISLTLGGIMLGGGAALAASWRGNLRARGAAAMISLTLPVCLAVVPIAVALLQRSIAGPVAEFARDRAIRNSAPLVADIESHRSANGRYPVSTLSVHPDYTPGLIGVREYRYEVADDAYNLFFELPSFRLGTQEIVMYNPRDRQSIASHALDMLQLTPSQLALDRTRGHYAVHETRHRHWKYFLFD